MRPNNTILLACAAGLPALFSACAKDVILSKKVTKTPDSGLVYALPKANVQVSVQRAIITADDVTTAKADATKVATKLAASKALLVTAKDELAALQGKLAVAGPAAKDELTKQVALSQAGVDYLTAQVANETTAVKAAKDKADALAGIVGEWQQTGSIKVLPAVPEAEARYVASINHGTTRDDDIKLTVANGLLSSGSATSVDQTPSIVMSLAQAAAALAGAPVIGPAASFHALTSPIKPQGVCESLNWVETFDPTDGKATQEALSRLTRLAPSMRLDIDGVHCNNIPGPNALCTVSKSLPVISSAPPIDSNGYVKGLVYRVPRQTVLTLASAKDFNVDDDPVCKFNTQVDAVSVVATIPDSSAAFVLPAHAGAFTTSNLSFGFKDGMPTDFGEHQPSELAAITGLPVQVAKALISIPAQMLQLRVNYDSQASALIDAKTTELKAQLDQLKAQRALDAAKAPTPVNTAASP